MPDFQMSSRLRNLARRLACGRKFYTKTSPRMTHKECAALLSHGFVTQSESLAGADLSQGYIFYPLGMYHFRKRCDELGITYTDNCDA